MSFPEIPPGGGARPRLARAPARVWVLDLALVASIGGAPVSGGTTAPTDDPGVLDSRTRTVLAWQIALESWGYSPGLLDGRMGPKTRLAIGAAQVALGREPTGHMDAETASALAVNTGSVLTRYRVTPEDETLVEPAPMGWNEKARRARLTYDSLADLVLEKFHTSRRLLVDLNPGLATDELAVGSTLTVPATRAFQRRPDPRMTHLEIDLDRKVVLILHEDARGRRYLQGLLHCSVAADMSQAPVGECRIVNNVENPSYLFRPEKWPEVHDVHEVLTIPPGPRNPVGLRWLGLDRSGYGIHGTPRPEHIGQTGSHGCFRLANWDAIWLSSLVGTRRDVPVRIVRGSSGTSWSWSPSS